MTPENFCYWLQGLLEVGNPEELNNLQVQIIKEHLNLVFRKETQLKATLPLPYIHNDGLKVSNDLFCSFAPINGSC